MRRKGASPLNVIGIIALGICFLIFAVTLALFGWAMPTSGSKGETGRSDTSTTLSGNTTNCSGVTSVPSEYMPWIKEAAKKYLGGNEALLIAIISVENNSWNSKSINSSSGAMGLGQFVYKTAVGFTAKGKSFYGLNIYDIRKVVGTPITTAVKQAFLTNARFSREGRHQPGPSLMATAELFSGHMKKYNNNIFEAYAAGYHTRGKNNEYKKVADATAQKLVDHYNKIKANGCSETNATSSTSNTIKK